MSDKAIKVLLIEDNPGDCRLIQEILAEAGGEAFNLECAERLSTGLERLARGGIDVVLLDLGLPDSQALGTFTSVYAQAPIVPIVVLTGLTDETLGVKALQKGAQDYLVKGQVDGNLLVRSIRYAIERKQAEEALRESEERYRALVNLGAEVGESIIMVQDNEQGLAIQTFVNDEWPRVTGYSKEELIGMSFLDLVHPEYREASMERYRRKMAGESVPGLFDLSIIRKDSTEVLIELTSAYTTYKGQRATVAYIRDITERKQMQEKLIATDRLASVGELAAGIAHELNNPLTSVIGFSELLLGKGAPDDIREDIAVIHHEAKRAAAVIKNLLTFAGKHPPSRQLVDINAVIASVSGLRAYEQQVSNIQVITSFAPDLPEVMADHFQLQQVFFNIITNAEYFMTGANNRGILTITTRRVGDVIRAFFADDGPGISKEDLGHVFDPFFTTKEVGQGTGLGLSICHGIITEHGGRIYAESESGKGATLVVELPVGNRQ